MLPARLRDLPYLVHTNRELGLMLASKKPLAVFVDGRDRWPDSLLRYFRLFDRHVTNGCLIRRDHYSDAGDYTAHHIMFALPSEEWRMQAMIDLRSGAEAWSAAHERREGELLGYADWMNDHWALLNSR